MKKQRPAGGAKKNGFPRPSMWWIYGLIAVFILGWHLMDDTGGSPVQSDWDTVERMVVQGEVERIEVVNRDQAQVYLKDGVVELYR
ncbi:MAG: peptidase M41, partial [Alistipes sp.]|nr:peptidase M41 [Alistipes sp.]